MKTIKILGMGCPKCKQAERVVNEAIRKLDVNVQVIKVEDPQQIMKYKVLSTPAIVIDDVVKISGHVPTIGEIIQYLN